MPAHCGVFGIICLIMLLSDNDGTTALMKAADYNKNPYVIKELLKRDDIDVNKQGQHLLNPALQLFIATDNIS